LPRGTSGSAVLDALEDLLEAAGWEAQSLQAAARVEPDLDRQLRKGVPEVILADGKQEADLLHAARRFVESTGRALLSRVEPRLLESLRCELPDCRFEEHAASRMVAIKRADFVVLDAGGRVGVISAGTSDVPIAEEAAVLAGEMGCKVELAYDVGVAGLHRLARPLRRMLAGGADVIVVAAGMDGALPSVVAGLVDVPVIGLPTSVGYGAGGRGLAALLSMLQTCSPGLTVVNIDNGVGAGASAALIANRVAAARRANEAT
jgi:NCAIR mutase (PurE)-related protein